MACDKCGENPNDEANCYRYTNELECSGGKGNGDYAGQSVDFAGGSIINSQDSCGWNKCLWKGEIGGAGSCVKDGDANLVDDCQGFTSGEAKNCKKDVTAPWTTMQAQGIPIVSYATQNISFTGSDVHNHGTQENKMGSFHYCVTSAEPGAQNTCLQPEDLLFCHTLERKRQNL